MLAGTVTLLFVSCPWNTDSTSFSDYRDTNLIAAQGFGAADAATGAPWFLTPGLTAATAEARDDGVTGVDYARFEQTAGSGAYAPPPEAPDAAVFRLEVVNLFQNGDFEVGDATEGWTASGDGLPNALTVSGDDAISGNQSLALNFELAETRFHTDLANTATGLADGFLPNTPYAFHIDFRLSVELFNLELNDNNVASALQTWSAAPPAIDPATTYSFPGRDRDNPARSENPNIIMRDPAQPDLTLLSFGGINTASQGRVAGRFDDIRFVRADQSHYLRLPVPYRAGGRPEISGGGIYTFSVWVKTDPATYDTADPAFGNRFPARHLSVGIDRTPEAAGPREIVDTLRASLRDVNAAPDTWHQLTWELSGHGIYPPFNAPGSFTVFDIVIEVGDAISGAAYQDAGSILMSAPGLTWQPR